MLYGMIPPLLLRFVSVRSRDLAVRLGCVHRREVGADDLKEDLVPDGCVLPAHFPALDDGFRGNVRPTRRYDGAWIYPVVASAQRPVFRPIALDVG